MRQPAVPVLSTALLLLVAFSGTASAQPSSSTDAFNSLTVESHPDWMTGLPAQTGLGTLSIPGTHDTLAIHGGLFPSYYEAQEDHGDGAATLDAQLNAGIRAIDIRVRVVNNNTAFAIHHTDVYQNANFDDVLTHARTFLSAHPGESVLMDLHGECDGDTTEGGSGSGSIGHCADDPSNITQADRVRIFNDYVSRYPGLFYAPSVTGNGTADMPTVGQARGHIVLTTFTGPRGQVYGGYGLTQLTTGDWGQYVENDWTQCDLNSKWGEAQSNMAKANTSGAMYTTYLSANCSPFGTNPADMAAGMNPKAVDYLNGGATNHVGVVMTDFPGHALVAALIRQQAGLLAGPVPSGVAGKCLDDYNSSATAGATVDLWSCNGSAAQHWTVMADRTLRLNGLCLDVTGGGTANGTHVELWTCGGGGNQQWTSGANGALVSAQSGKCLDDPGASATDGTQLIIWDCNAGTNQRWTLP
jgi:1-phosphatidylinositol phosphodiesterase